MWTAAAANEIVVGDGASAGTQIHISTCIKWSVNVNPEEKMAYKSLIKQFFPKPLPPCNFPSKIENFGALFLYGYATLFTRWSEDAS